MISIFFLSSSALFDYFNFQSHKRKNNSNCSLCANKIKYWIENSFAFHDIKNQKILQLHYMLECLTSFHFWFAQRNMKWKCMQRCSALISVWCENFHWLKIKNYASKFLQREFLQKWNSFASQSFCSTGYKRIKGNVQESKRHEVIQMRIHHPKCDEKWDSFISDSWTVSHFIRNE